jgi:hypothetical protein
MKTNQEVIEFLEKLVHSRFSEESLNNVLSEFFRDKVKVYNASQGRIDNGEDDDELSDFNLMANVSNEVASVDFDIYMLPMRCEGFDGATMYITEVGYEFI